MPLTHWGTKLRGLASLAGNDSAQAALRPEDAFLGTTEPRAARRERSYSGGERINQGGSVIPPAVGPTGHSAGMTDGGSGHADTSYSGPEWAASEADLRDHAVRLRNWRWR